MHYELIVDCGTANDRFELESEEAVRNFMCEFEGHYKGVTEDLIKKGVTTCGIDTIFLNEVFESYNIKVNSLLQDKETKFIEVVSAIQIDKYDGLEVMTQKVCYKGKGKDIKFCVNETYCSYHTVEGLYKKFDLVGEDFKLFIKE